MKKCGNKKCAHGGRLQDDSEFHKDKNMKSGLQSHCKTCYKKRYNYVKVKDRIRDDWGWIYEN